MYHVIRDAHTSNHKYFTDISDVHPIIIYIMLFLILVEDTQ